MGTVRASIRVTDHIILRVLCAIGFLFCYCVNVLEALDKVMNDRGTDRNGHCTQQGTTKARSIVDDTEQKDDVIRLDSLSSAAIRILWQLVRIAACSHARRNGVEYGNSNWENRE